MEYMHNSAPYWYFVAVMWTQQLRRTFMTCPGPNGQQCGHAYHIMCNLMIKTHRCHIVSSPCFVVKFLYHFARNNQTDVNSIMVVKIWDKHWIRFVKLYGINYNLIKTYGISLVHQYVYFALFHPRPLYYHYTFMFSLQQNIILGYDIYTYDYDESVLIIARE